MAMLKTTVSTCTAETEQAKHVFEIFDYSKHRGIGNGQFIRSGAFSVGGHDWAVRFYPDGFSFGSKDSISVYLELLSKDSKVRAGCETMMVEQATGVSKSIQKTELRMFNSCDSSRLAAQGESFMHRATFEAPSSPYLQDDHLTIECVVTVRKQPQVSTTKPLNKIEVPPSNLAEHLGKLLGAEEGADITFIVGGESFPAHKVVLAMRSPVFKAQFFGPMREARAQHLTIEDMQPSVFGALLHFVYNDCLPADMSAASDEGDDGDIKEMIRHLLVAADRYAVDRLKLMCQSILCESLDVETVSATLALAYQHSCDRLKDICLEFITSPDTMDAVVATEGYSNLKTTCPSALADAFEKSMRIRKA